MDVNIQICTHTSTCAHAHKHAHSRTHAYICNSIQTRKHTVHVHTETCTHVHTHMHTKRTCINATHVRTHSLSHARTRACARTQTCTRAAYVSQKTNQNNTYSSRKCCCGPIMDPGRHNLKVIQINKQRSDS